MSNELRKNVPKELVERLEELKRKEEGNMKQTQELPIWFDGKYINEILLYEFLLQQHEVKCINGILYDMDGEVSDAEMEKEILLTIKDVCTKNIFTKVNGILNGFKIYTREDPFPLQEDRIHLQNGTYYLGKGFIPQKEWTRNRLSVFYDPNASDPIRWDRFLKELLTEEDILCLQEFMGYCLIPSNRGQCMLMIIGKGGEGKSRIGRVLKKMLGKNMNVGSIQKLEHDRFARADQEGKLLYLDDDLKTEALSSTNTLKTIVTIEDEMDLEKKCKQSYQGKLYCRLMTFGNGTLKALYDRSDGFYRRQIILTTKEIPKNRENDPYLGDKLRDESEGILLWCIEGLERLIKNQYKFSLSNKTVDIMNEIKEEADNIIPFLKSTGYVRIEKGTYATTKALYVAYKRWCEDNLVNSAAESSFAKRFKEISSSFGLVYDKNLRNERGLYSRGFRGIAVMIRTDDSVDIRHNL